MQGSQRVFYHLAAAQLVANHSDDYDCQGQSRCQCNCRKTTAATVTQGNKPERLHGRVFRLVAQDKAAAPAIIAAEVQRRQYRSGKPTNKEQPQVCLDHRPLCRSEAPTDNTTE